MSRFDPGLLGELESGHAAAAMDLQLTGHPLHTRLQTVVVARREDGSLAVEARHLDVRKRGFVPVGSDLQPSGVIHQMTVRAGLDAGAGVLTGIESEMAVPAFEPSELSRGETCRDVAGAQPALARVPLGAADGGAAAAIGAAMGGERGCSHVLALTQMMASTVAWALPRGAGWDGGPPRRLFQRTLSIDGAQPDEGSVELAAQSNDLFFTAATGAVNPMDRFAAQHEARVLMRVDLGSVGVGALFAAERDRDRESLRSAPWRRRDDAVAALVSAPFLSGFAKRVLAEMRGGAEDQPLRDILLALAPTFIQVCACFSEDWPQRCLDNPTLVGIGGIPGSCYMWRRDGAMHSRKRETDPMGQL